jgi:putative glutamine amidotransferase
MGVSPPVIGITAALETARWGVWEDVEANLSPRTYSIGVAESGAIPLILPAANGAAAEAERLLDMLDGLILAGGGDLDPATYGAAADAHTADISPERDRFELALAGCALERDLPLLGICRGMEVLNVALGGTLEQHLADAELHLHTPGRFSDHRVRLEPGSLAARAFGAQRLSVRSHHHQGVARLGDGLVASGWAEPGGAVEAIEARDRGWALGVLWHAEEEHASPAIGALAAAAREQAIGVGA